MDEYLNMKRQSPVYGDVPDLYRQRILQDSARVFKDDQGSLTWYHGPRMPKEGFILSCPHLANNNSKQSLIRPSSLILQHPLFLVTRYIVFWHCPFIRIRYDSWFYAAPAKCGEKLSIVGSQFLYVNFSVLRKPFSIIRQKYTWDNLFITRDVLFNLLNINRVFFPFLDCVQAFGFRKNDDDEVWEGCHRACEWDPNCTQKMLGYGAEPKLLSVLKRLSWVLTALGLTQRLPTRFGMWSITGGQKAHRGLSGKQLFIRRPTWRPPARYGFWFSPTRQY